MTTIEHLISCLGEEGAEIAQDCSKINRFGKILHLDTPPAPWPQAGFQLGAGWLRRGWKGSTYVHRG